MSECKLCNLNTKCKNPGIFGQSLGFGTQKKVMIVQDYVTFRDDRADEVPHGDTEAKLKYFLRKADIDIKDVYFTSGIKCSVPKAGDIKKKHITVCRDLLLQEIREIKPKIIIAMGKVSHWVLSDEQSFTEFTGHFEDFSLDYEVTHGLKTMRAAFSCKVMPTFGLNASLNKWEYNVEIIRHMKKAMAYLENPMVPRTVDPKLNVILNQEQLKAWHKKMLTLTKKDIVATDLETTGFEFFKDKIINSGYCVDGKTVDIIYLEKYLPDHIKSFDGPNKARAVQINTFISRYHKEVMVILKQVHAHIRTVLHNGKFDSKFSAFNGVPYQDFYADTLVGDSLVDENLMHGLNFCFERNGINFGPYDTELWPYTNKDEKKRKSYQWVPPYLLEKYLGYDCYGLRLLWDIQEKQIEKAGLTDHFFRRKMPALKMVTQSEFIGMKADKKLIVAVSKAITTKQNVTLDKLKKMTKDEEFNPNSGKQISAYMVAQGYPLDRLEIPENATGYSTAGEHLQKLVAIKKYAEFPKLILDYKKLMKIKGTYVDGKNGDGGMLKYLDPAHRIHTNFNIWSPRTSRWSARSPSVQVWPRPVTGLPNARNFIIPKPGWNLFEADFSALEMAVVAGLSKDPVMTKLLNDGTDIHSYNAVSLGKILKMVDDDITYEKFLEYIGKGSIPVETIQNDPELKAIYLKYSELRTNVKNVGFGLSYGKSAHSFAEEFEIPEEEAQDMVDAYFDVYKGIKKWRDQIVKEALLYGEVKLQSGRPRRFHGAVDWINAPESKDTWSAKKLREEIARQAMNYPVQGGAHEVFEPACIRLTRRFKSEGMSARLGFYIHDGILGECPPEENQMVAKLIKAEMPYTFNKGTDLELKLKIDTDFYRGCWYGEKFHVA